MERILSSKQMRDADRFTIDKLGVSEDVLVLRAGKAVAEEIKKRFNGGRVLVCVGNGNNGADGRIVAKELCNTKTFSVAVFDISDGLNELLDEKYDVIVDCLFGTGLNREITGEYLKIIKKINSSDAFVVSCDIPSGLNADAGKPMAVAVKANLTVAIQEYKLGHFLNDGPDFTGEIISKDIGISLLDDKFVYKIDNNCVKQLFKPRCRNSNKGSYGKTAIIGGSKNFTGSVILSTNSLCALKTGVGYATLVVPESLFSSYVGKVPECILKSFLDSEEISDFTFLKQLFSHNSIAVGMGMGVSENTYKIIRYLLENYTGKLLIDADGLNSLATFGVDVLLNKKAQVVLTPHIVEFSRLSGLNKAEIIENTIKSALDFANKYGVTLVLKNAVSVITNGDEIILNTTGCPAMAKAGSGDVLSGIIAGLLARTDNVLNACAVGCYLFGKSGEIAVLEQNEYTVTATDIINCLTKAITVSTL